MSTPQEMTQIADNIEQNEMEGHQPLTSNAIVSPVQYVATNEVREAVEQAKVDNQCKKEQFLLQYYSRILIQHGIILILFLLGQRQWFLTIFVKYGYFCSCFRWTWFATLFLFIIIILSIPIIKRYSKVIKHQNKVFYVQTILIGFLLIGIAGVQNSKQLYTETVQWIVWILLILMGHSIIQIILIKREITRYFAALAKIIIVGLVVILPNNIFFDFIIRFCEGYLNQTYPIAEVLIIYILYYFHSLNESLLNNDLPENFSFMERIKIIYEIKGLFKKSAEQNQFIQQVKDSNFILNKYLTIMALSFAIYFLIVLLGIVTGNTIFIAIIIIVQISVLSLILNTQVANKNLKEEEVSFAVCMTYLDLASPFKNILRRIFQ